MSVVTSHEKLRDGSFTADCLPGSTYCVFVKDVHYVSNTIDLILYEPGTGKSMCRNINLLPIDYAFLPRLRGRLTLSRLALDRKP